MSRSGNQYVYTVEINNKLDRVYKNRRRMNRWLGRLLEKHREEGWEISDDKIIRDLYINLRARNVNNGIYRTAMLTFDDYQVHLKKQVRVRCWVIKSERII